MPRLKPDELLLDSAIEAGARVSPGHDFIGVFDEYGKIYRVEFNAGGEIASAHARWCCWQPAPVRHPLSALVYSCDLNEGVSRFVSMYATNAWQKILTKCARQARENILSGRPAESEFSILDRC
ncbi:MAG: hypothetical protein ACREUR_04000 [Nitrosospira sp.]